MKPYLKMKDSGIEWIGKIPEHWEFFKLKFVFDIIKNGIWGSNQLNDEHDIICIRVADFNRKKNSIELKNPTIRNISFDEKEKHLLENGDLLLERSGGGEKQPVGFTVIYEGGESAVCSNFISRLKPSKKFNSKFLNHFFAAMYINRENVKYIHQTTGIQNLDLDYLNRIYPLPTINEQNKIEKFLESESTKIEEETKKKQNLIKLLREKQRSLINCAITKGLDSSIPMKDSGIEWIGKIPEHWEIKTLKKIIKHGTSITYGIVQTGEHVENGIPCLRTSDMKNDTFPKNGYIKTSNEIDAKFKRSKVYENDIVVAIRATVGKAIIVPNYLDGANLTQGTAKISPNETMDNQFVLNAINSESSQQRFQAIMKGATFKEITLEMLRNFVITCPPLDEQKEISKFIDSKVIKIEKLILYISSEIEKLQEYKGSLITSAVTGKIDVREAVV